ncbi:MAG: DUF4397 domain-containing protein [Woeseiaceae bacterium]
MKKLKIYGILRNTLSASIGNSVVVLALAVLLGCSDTARVDATGKGSIRGINSIADAPELNFLIEERSIDTAFFKEAAGFAEYDDLTYNFNFDGFLTSAPNITRIATQSLDVRADTEHTIILSGSLASPTTTVWEDPAREFSDTDTVFEADFYHLAASVGEVDIYFATVGTTPVLGAAVGSLNVGERISYREFPDGAFELIVTAKDDPNVILHQSGDISAAAATRVSVGLFDPDPSITANIGVALITADGTSLAIPDVNSPSRVRLLHAASGTGNIDGFVNNDLTTAVFPNVAFGEIANYVDTLVFPLPTTITAAGNSGAPIVEQDVTLGANASKTIALAGDPANPVLRELNDNARPISTFPQLRLTSFSVNAGPVDIYLVEPGTTISADSLPLFFNLPFLLDTGFVGPDGGTFDMLVAAAGSQIPISAPLSVTLQNGAVLDAAILDTVDPTVVELRIINAY